LIWQYTDSNGTLDRDVFNGTLDQLKALAGLSGLPTVKPNPPEGCGTIPPGRGLGPGDAFESCDCRFKLIMQQDGNLALYGKSGPALWATNTNNGYAAVMQDDGNFVLYGKSSDPIWASNTYGHQGA